MNTDTVTGRRHTAVELAARKEAIITRHRQPRWLAVAVEKEESPNRRQGHQ
jgi:hypothetical protein